MIATYTITDHPHAGGEHNGDSGTAIGAYGPSPRGWGALPQ